MSAQLKIGDLVVHQFRSVPNLGILTKIFRDTAFDNDTCPDRLCCVYFNGSSLDHVLASSLKKVNP